MTLFDRARHLVSQFLGLSPASEAGLQLVALASLREAVAAELWDCVRLLDPARWIWNIPDDDYKRGFADGLRAGQERIINRLRALEMPSEDAPQAARKHDFTGHSSDAPPDATDGGVNPKSSPCGFFRTSRRWAVGKPSPASTVSSIGRTPGTWRMAGSAPAPNSLAASAAWATSRLSPCRF